MGVTGGWERVVATEKKEKVDTQVCYLIILSPFRAKRFTSNDQCTKVAARISRLLMAQSIVQVSKVDALYIAFGMKLKAT